MSRPPVEAAPAVQGLALLRMLPRLPCHRDSTRIIDEVRESGSTGWDVHLRRVRHSTRHGLRDFRIRTLGAADAPDAPGRFVAALPRHSIDQLRRFECSHAPQDLVLRASRKKIAPHFIRPYAICLTPPFLALS